MRDGPEDLKERVEAVERQIRELHRLNSLLRESFEHLSTAIHQAKQRGLLSDEEFVELAELNDRGNWAKHEGLGPKASQAEAQRVHGCRQGDAPRDASELGDRVSELERLYAKMLGRPLPKNEPRYRQARSRPGGIGDFVMIVRLDEVDPPLEFVGDAYVKKQHAKHSAALQAVLYLTRHDAGACAARSVSSRAVAADADRDAGVGACTGAACAASATCEASAPPAAAATRHKSTSSQGLQAKATAAGDPAASAAGLSTATAAGPSGDASPRVAAWSADCGLGVGAVAGAGGAAVSDCAAAPPLQGCAEQRPRPRGDRKGGQGEAAKLSGSGGDREVGGEPTDDDVVDALRRAGKPLPVREVYLLSLGRDPRREQMGSGVKKAMNKQLYQLKDRGLLASHDGMWTLVA